MHGVDGRFCAVFWFCLQTDTTLCTNPVVLDEDNYTEYAEITFDAAPALGPAGTCYEPPATSNGMNTISVAEEKFF